MSNTTRVAVFHVRAPSPTSRTVYLNNRPLESIRDALLPDYTSQLVKAQLGPTTRGGVLMLPPASYAFLVFEGARWRACDSNQSPRPSEPTPARRRKPTFHSN